MQIGKLTLLVFVTAAASLFSSNHFATAAEDLKLRAGISFTQDVDNGFPIVATDIDDAKLDPSRATLIFYGAAGDLNTNRQAKRLVDLYRKVSAKEVKFIIVDVDHASSEDAKKLIRKYYKGYIPFQVVLDKSGNMVWSAIGEVENGVVKNQLSKVGEK